MKSISAVLMIAVVGPIAAMDLRDPESVAQERVAEARAATQASAERARMLDATLNALDGVAGELIEDVLDRDQIAIDFAALSVPVQSELIGGKMTIHLSDALPAHPRVYGPLIAHEVLRRAPFMINEKQAMPECAEYAYMRAATVARVFYELGGEFKKLPMVDGDRVDIIQDIVGAWLPNWKFPRPMLWDILQAATRAKVKAAAENNTAAVAKCEEAIALIDQAEARYRTFLNEEWAARQDAAARER